MADILHHDETRYLDDTTIQTLSYLESRLMRIEHILYGHAAHSSNIDALPNVQNLEHRFAQLTQRFRTYGELLDIYNAHPNLFSAPSTDAVAPPELSTAALAQMVLASSSLFPSTASALNAISDTPVADPALSANVISLLPRMRAVEATQKAQAAEVAELKRQSELLIRRWYEQGVVGYGDFVADTEKRLGRAERAIRRAEKVREDA
ncbi:nuclear distribution protein [Truncatella angustata]|uniref:Nuclear distribution protein n=1 Tax=Truncatella angustata TaxID=152316 RepID=A0A9P8RF12_9PEZI|nr:nuclear distribution protein [Truncatella angustata]KAH6643392.1 nuclear distribution protein [Truncatella angustata]